MNEAIKIEYEILAKKYSLPKFEVINNEFEICNLEHEEFLIRELLHKLYERVDRGSKFIEPFFQPDTNSLVQMSEFRFVDEPQKAELFELFKQLMKINREMIVLIIERDDDKTGAYISALYKQWPALMQKISAIAKKLSLNWIELTDIKFNADYVG